MSDTLQDVFEGEAFRVLFDAVPKQGFAPHLVDFFNLSGETPNIQDTIGSQYIIQDVVEGNQ